MYVSEEMYLSRIVIDRDLANVTHSLQGRREHIFPYPIFQRRSIVI